MSQVQFVELANPLGFTNETAALISGLGCTNLKQFKKKDISLDDLQNLTKEDLEVLGVGDTFDFESFEKLKKSLKKKYNKGKNPPGIEDVIKILKSTRKQIELIHYYLGYLHIKLKENHEDYFIDKNKNLKVSQVIIEACDNIFTEVSDFKAALASLDRLKQRQQDQKNFNVVKSLKGFIAVISSISVGVGLSLFITYKFL